MLVLIAIVEVMKEPLNEKNVLKNLRATDWAVIVVSMNINTTKISRILKFLLITFDESLNIEGLATVAGNKNKN